MGRFREIFGKLTFVRMCFIVTSVCGVSHAGFVSTKPLVENRVTKTAVKPVVATPKITYRPDTVTQVIHDTIKTKCEDCGALVALAVRKTRKECPVCEICDNTPLVFLDYEVDRDSIFVRTNKKVISGRVHHKVGSKPIDQR